MEKKGADGTGKDEYLTIAEVAAAIQKAVPGTCGAKYSSYWEGKTPGGVFVWIYPQIGHIGLVVFWQHFDRKGELHQKRLGPLKRSDLNQLMRQISDSDREAFDLCIWGVSSSFPSSGLRRSYEKMESKACSRESEGKHDYSKLSGRRSETRE